MADLCGVQGEAAWLYLHKQQYPNDETSGPAPGVSGVEEGENR